MRYRKALHLILRTFIKKEQNNENKGDTLALSFIHFLLSRVHGSQKTTQKITLHTNE